MFEHLKKFEKILVTGPQRSGTTICAKMIAVDTGHEFLSEAHLEGESHIDYQFFRLREILETKRGFVLQCPSLSRMIHNHLDDEALVIFMIRDVADIQCSEKRIGWNGKGQLKYYSQPENSEIIKGLSGSISEKKYQFWEAFQKPLIENWLEIEYESLNGHPLWVPEFRRRNFSARQISEDNRFAGEIFLNG